MTNLVTGQLEAYDDVLEHPGDFLEQTLTVVPRRDPIVVGPADSISAVLAQLKASSATCVLVLNDGRVGGELLGIFSEQDVLQKLVGAPVDLDRAAVGHYMTVRPDPLPEDTTIAYALNRMAIDGQRYVPIVGDQGRPVGVLETRDIVDWLADTYPSQVLNVPPVPSSYPSAPEGA